jgi:tryptophan synthase alpha chain
MNRIADAFKGKKAFIGFLTAGDPCADSTVEFILEMEKGGADLIEIGIPFSDPVAEGPVIEAANIRALEKGVYVRDVFEIVRKVREQSEIPLVFLTYLNPVFFFGYEEFFAECQRVGIDGIIIPDLPFEESREVSDVCEKYGVHLISLVTPTSESRTKMLVENAKGFLYFVSSLGTTGVREEIEMSIKPKIEAIKAMTDTPVAVGFGISRAEQAAELRECADGVIIGSAIVEIITEHKENAGAFLREYVAGIKAVL